MDKRYTSKFFNRLGFELRTRRTDKGLTQETVAKMVGLKRTSIVNIEAGRQKPPLMVLVGIARTLGTSASEILGGVE